METNLSKDGKGQQKLQVSINSSLQAIYDICCKEKGNGFALIKQSLEFVSWQQRNETTVLQSLLSTALNPQWVAVLLVLDSKIREEGGSEQSLEAYVKQKNLSTSKPVGLIITVESADRLVGESHIGLTPEGMPVISAAAMVEMTGGSIQNAAVALTGTSQESVQLSAASQLLKGNKLNNDLIEKIALEIEKEAQPKSDYRGNAKYRKAMSRIMARRALETCMKGAK